MNHAWQNLRIIIRCLPMPSFRIICIDTKMPEENSPGIMKLQYFPYIVVSAVGP